ncbi:hypothetical protein HYH02_006295 [Chlamydomonas schloesseri]|uniref:Aminopeptidase P N-terminal domain-containing protein n=1 Tax=Chlamydomonas schloesseri TaxID=2026947 RepID=A0A836B5Z1_9CHLO|nr:hypothetical protein HYH02_006295 [Chlamydomonas schloesseri]|eukprot:KAG2448403.1 hypothetical protein HYH02_006295 [Chlamydomonas schloesseri]
MILRVVAGLVRAGHAPSLSTLRGLASGHNGSALHTSQQACQRAFGTSPSPEDRPPLAGQPIPSTHPELLAPGQLTPGVTAAEYAARRQQLAELLPPGSIAVLPSAATTYMAGVIPWPYRQDPDYYYLTGLNQHGLAIITSARAAAGDQGPAGAGGGGGGGGGGRFILFIDAPNAQRTKWDGAGVSREVAAEVFGADEVHYMHEMPRRLAALASAAAASSSSSSSSSPLVLFDSDRVGGHHYSTLMALLKPALETPGRISPLRPLLHNMRLVKSPAEAGLMRASAVLASAALRHCMASTVPGVTEYGLAAAFEYGVKAGGAARLAYPTVCAGGADACTIHYGRNDKTLQAGQMVLMDAGCEYGGYVSDVTRTWPVAGRGAAGPRGGRGGFSGPQRDVYAVVLEAHQRCLAATRPGSSIRDLHHLCIDVLSEGIRDLGLRPGASLAEIRGSMYRDYFWHSLGHYLGLDTHDTHLVGHDRPLAPGMIITVEPGLYIPDDPRYGPLAGLGVRIEDDVAVTAAGCEVLSDQAPVAIAEVEELAGSAVEAAAAAEAAARAGGAEPRTLPLPPRGPQPALWQMMYGRVAASAAAEAIGVPGAGAAGATARERGAATATVS